MLHVELIQPPFETIFQRMLNGNTDTTSEINYQPVPNNQFLDRRYVLAPFNSGKVALRINSDVADRRVDIRIQSVNPTLKINPLKETNAYLQNLSQTVLVDLEEGPNYIVVRDPQNEESAFTIINCRRYAGMLYAFVQEIYNNAIVTLDEQEAAIYSKYATRLAEPLLGSIFYLFSDVRSLQLLSTRLVTKTLVGKASYSVGVRETGAALTLNTPLIVEPIKDREELDLVRYPLLSYAEFNAGKIAHTWFPNTEVVRWQAFQTYIDNMQGYDLVDVSEDEIIIEHAETGEKERHIFDFEKNKNYFANRRYNVDIFIRTESQLPVNFIAPGYPFDMIVDEYHLLGNDRHTFDMGIPFDSGLTFDSELFDEGHDGYLGMSLVDRNELSWLYPHLGYDSTLHPAYGSGLTTLVYTKGYYCKGVDIESSVASVSFIPSASGTFDP